MLQRLIYWLSALYLPGVGPRTFLRWLAEFADVQALFQASEDEWQAKDIPEKYWAALRAPPLWQIEKDLRWAEGAMHSIMTFDDETYPPLLKEISAPPLVLFIKGEASLLAQPQIAIVGSRHATRQGIQHAEEFAKYLAEAGYIITSGLAVGVDGASHEGALSGNGKTIGVAGTGLDYLYPSKHQSLFAAITQSGVIVSEFPLATPPKASNFPQRNRIIAGLSLGVLVIEAAIKSGSLITARYALEEGREVFAIPGSIHQPLARGCHHLIRQGAKLVETGADIMEELGALKSLTALKNKNKVPAAENLPAPEAQLLTQIDYELTPIDMILLRSGLTAARVSSMLLVLELNGYIQSVPGGYIRANREGLCLKY